MHPENPFEPVHSAPSLQHIRSRHGNEFHDEALLAQLEAILQSARDGIIVSDPAGNLLMWNPAGLSLHGYKELADAKRHLSDLTGTFEVYAPVNGSKRQTSDKPLPLTEWPMSRLMRGESFTDYELLVRRFDTGNEWWGSYSGAPARDGNGNAHLLVLTVRDISERKRAEESQREVLEALQTKSREVTSILESVTDAFFALDESWCFTYVNSEAERVLMYGRGELLGKNIWEEFPGTPGSEFETQYRRAVREQVTAVFQAYYPPLEAMCAPTHLCQGWAYRFTSATSTRSGDEKRSGSIFSPNNSGFLPL